MSVFDIVCNYNYVCEFPFVVQVWDSDGSFISERCSWCDNIPDWILRKDVRGINLANGYGSKPHSAVMIIDVFYKD